MKINNKMRLEYFLKRVIPYQDGTLILDPFWKHTTNQNLAWRLDELDAAIIAECKKGKP